MLFSQLKGMDSTSVLLPTSEFKELYAGWKQSQVCDSILNIQDHQLNEMDRQNYLLREYLERDSIQLIQKDEIIDMVDKEVRKQKRQKFFFGGVGIIGIVLLLLL